ncbi:MAG: Gfo/Idh/MocA family oxidoreductase [Armatimonadetes bacterium]|nr:Gfo/Idh/MocA family oxidoreductase [Armatimonadota bacterium]
MSDNPVTAAIVGCGHRGLGYGRYSLRHPDQLKIVAVADPNDIRRQAAAEEFDVPPDMQFRTAEELAERPQLADAVINGTMDQHHIPTTLPLLESGYDVLLEKPICQTREDLLKLLEVTLRTSRKLMIGHVLRYAPFYVGIKQRILDGEIGEIMAVHSEEAVSYHHWAAAFVRGRWNRREINPFLLAKCCHDLDLIAWFKSGIRPLRVASFGSRMYFTEEHAPEGSGTRCLVDCEIEESCPYSARKNYLEQKLWGPYCWEAIEHIENPTEEDKIESLKTYNPHGQCVWRTDGDIVDHQSVIAEFADGATASHDLIAGTARPGRTIHICGTLGEIEGFMESGKFVIRHPDAREGHEYSEVEVDMNVSADMHGGGDLRLVEDFVKTVRGEEPSISTTSVFDSVYGHLIAFAADEAMTGHRVVEIEDLQPDGG